MYAIRDDVATIIVVVDMESSSGTGFRWKGENFNATALIQGERGERKEKA